MVNIANLNELSKLELAQALMERLTISANDWHQLKSNRKVRASEQAAAALVSSRISQRKLCKDSSKHGWLDRSISAPPCPTHGHQRQQRQIPSKTRGSQRLLTCLPSFSSTSGFHCT